VSCSSRVLLSLNLVSQQAETNRPFQFQKRRQFFVGVHNEALTVAAMCVSHEDRSPFAIHGCDAAPAPTGCAEIVSDDCPIPKVTSDSLGGSTVLAKAVEVSNRQEFVRFPTAGCNLLCPWFLSPLPFGLLANPVGILYDSVLERHKCKWLYLLIN
jgi:hypothetical protein